MDSTQKGFRRLHRMVYRYAPRQQTSQFNTTDFSRVMVVMNQRTNQTRTSTKVRRVVLDLLGTFFDEEA